VVARPLLTLIAQKLGTCEHEIFTSRMRVHSPILHRIEIVSCFQEALIVRAAYLYKEVPNTTIQRLVEIFWERGSVCLREGGGIVM
jgi:hypothetical protein